MTCLTIRGQQFRYYQDRATKLVKGPSVESPFSKFKPFISPRTGAAFEHENTSSF
jgi:hypothetical protein